MAAPLKRKKFRKINFRVFAIILFITASVSVMLKLNKDFNYEVKVPLHFVNIPKDKLLKTTSDKQVLVTGRANGYDYFKYWFHGQEFDIDLSTVQRRDSIHYYYVFDPERDLLDESLLGTKIRAYKPDTLFVTLDKSYEKKVPVVSLLKLNFIAGFGSLAGLRLKPDSVVVRGPKTSMDSLTKVFTNKRKIKPIGTSISDSIGLHTYRPIKQLEIIPSRIAYSIDVDKFTEANLIVPIQLINVPPHITAKVFPKQVNVIFNVDFDNYDKLKSSDFKVICDFEQIDKMTTTITPQITSYPAYVRDVRLVEKTVQYLLVK